jgi:hypothetical protein
VDVHIEELAKLPDEEFHVDPGASVHLRWVFT